MIGMNCGLELRVTFLNERAQDKISKISRILFSNRVRILLDTNREPAFVFRRT